MSFLAPLFLLGALAVALPVVFHLIRRTTRERTVFSSLMFLNPTPPRLTRRSRLEHLMLLLLRCGVLCALAVGFARPFFKETVASPPRGGKRLLVLVDTSASMRRPELWAAAREQAETLLRRSSPADQVALLTFDVGVRSLMTFEQWNVAAPEERAALASQKLANVRPGYSATQLGQALIHAAETLADAQGKSELSTGEIALISDLQEGSHPEPLQGYEWPKNIEVTPYPVKAKQAGNASLQWVAEADEGEPKGAATVRVRVSNSADSHRETLKLAWTQAVGGVASGPPVTAYVPAGHSRLVTMPLPGPGSQSDCIQLQGDEVDFDNSVFVVPPETARPVVCYSGAEAENDPKRLLYFLRRAFQETRRQAVQVQVHPPSAPLSPADVSAALWVIADPGPAERIGVLREQVLAGKTVLYVVGTETAGPALARLLGVEQCNVREAHPDHYAMLAEIDFRHPLFAPFADPRFSDFTKIHFWKYRQISTAGIPGARVLARFDSGDPALMEVPVGKGRVLILASSWQPDDSQLALSTKFVPLLYAVLESSAAAAPAPSQYVVGETVALEPLLGPAPGPATLRTADGKEVHLAAGDKAFSGTLVPGIYAITSTQPAKRFAVNLDPAESRVTPLPADELERLGVPMTRSVAVALSPGAREARLRNAELESRQKLWRWCIVAALGLVLMETWLAGLTVRRSFRPGPVG